MSRHIAYAEEIHLYIISKLWTTSNFFSDTSTCYYNQPNLTLQMSHGKEYFLWSPNYPLYYPYDLPCTWLLNSEENTHIRVEIEDVYLLCDLDSFSFGDGHDPSNSSSVILQRKRVLRTRVLHSSINSMWIVWSPQECKDYLYEELRYYLDLSLSMSNSNFNLPFPVSKSDSNESYVTKTEHSYGFFLKVTSLFDDG